MKKILLISGHPDISHSTANRIITEEILDDKRITAIDIKLNYPDYNIDVEKEQQQLLSAELIILQVPFMWYGLPAHVKLWIENVFTHGFAFGKEGDKLKGKSFLLSLTMGGNQHAYSTGGQHEHPVEFFLKPIELFIRYCGLNYLPPVYSYSMTNDSDGYTIQEKSIQHAQRIKESVHRFIKAKENKMPVN